MSGSNATPDSSRGSLPSPLDQPGGSRRILTVPIAPPGTPGVPMFDGTNATEFLSRYRDFCDDYQLSVPEMIARMPRYCVPTLYGAVKSLLESVDDKTSYSAVTKALKKEYRRHDAEQQMLTRGFLETLKNIKRDDASDTRGYCRLYKTVSETLIKRKKLDEFTQTGWFLEGLPEKMKERLIRKLDIDPEESETMKWAAVSEAAEKSLASQEAVSRFSTPTGQDKTLRDLAAKYVVRPTTGDTKLFIPPVVTAPVAPSVDDLTQKMAALALPTQAIMKDFADGILKTFQTAAGPGRWATPPPTVPRRYQGPPPQPAPTRFQPTASASTGPSLAPPQVTSYANAVSGCYGCGMDDHGLRFCPSMEILKKEGKCHINHRGRISIGPADQNGPEVRRGDQPFAMAIETLLAQFPAVTPATAPAPPAAVKAIRLGSKAPESSSDSDTEEEIESVSVAAARRFDP
ncbi:MAG: hypothetical protein LQ350_008367 [Teloschistes chrysophthalmus]|nr:MAG: hypothetical protein LQ350_008367 [Niorma chrysophthalma]